MRAGSHLAARGASPTRAACKGMPLHTCLEAQALEHSHIDGGQHAHV